MDWYAINDDENLLANYVSRGDYQYAYINHIIFFVRKIESNVDKIEYYLGPYKLNEEPERHN
jgi:hypothetical protein